MTKLIPILCLLSSCTESIISVTTAMRPHCEKPEDRKALAEFIIRCAEAANPKSDEEGEDLVKQCQWSGEEALCPLTKQCLVHHSWEPCP